MGFCGTALVILIGLSQLTTSIAERVLSANQIPRVLVTCIVLNCLFHALSKESCDVHETIIVSLGSIISHVEVFIGNAIIVHDPKRV